MSSVDKSFDAAIATVTNHMTRPNLIKRTKYWQNKMGLQNWDIDVRFDKEEFKTMHSDGWSSTAAFVRCNDQYKFATIYYNPDKLSTMDDSTIVHELLHVVMSPLTNFAHTIATRREDGDVHYFKEQATSELERIFMRVMK